MIVQPSDITNYSIALKNSGITFANIELLERQFILHLFGKEGAKALISYINANRTETKEEHPNAGDYEFGSAPVGTTIHYDFADINELIYGDKLLFEGLLPLLAIMLCCNFLSQNRIQVARQNVTKQPNGARTTTKREEMEVVQALAYSAHNIVYAMNDYLQTPANNPLNLHVNTQILPQRYFTNTSGRMPLNAPFLSIIGWGGMYY